MSISRNNDQVTLNWPGTYQLQGATTAIGPYNDVAGVTNSPYSVIIGGNAMFFRLKQ